jgi:serine O-acetyltransferase
MFELFWRIRLLALRTPAPLNAPFRLLYRILEFLGGATIPLQTEFGGQPCLPHGIHGVFISAGARLGRNCVIFQQVTIGSNMLVASRGFGFPEIGDNCYLGAGAKIIGNVKLGDNVRVGANAVVHRDVPSNSVVTAAEQTVRPLSDPDNRYYTYRGGAWRYFDDGAWIKSENQDLLGKRSG